MDLNLNGYTTLPPGKLASIATSLEMRTRPAPTLPLRADIGLEHLREPDLDWYLALFARIGEPWLWFGRRVMARAEVLAIIRHPQVEVYAVRSDGSDIGFVELDRREPGVVELAYFGLVPEATGAGIGRYVMERALDLAFASDPARVWVHTCTLDHPGALAFYQKCGFTAFQRLIEVVDDPRLTGALPPDAGRFVPVL